MSPASPVVSSGTASRRASLAYTAGETRAADVPSDRLATGSAVAVTTKSIGNRAEDAAAVYLQCEGHEIVDRNWRTRFCEIDIISRHGDTVYFTEVKYRKNARHGDGLAAITAKKQRQMKFAAEVYASGRLLNEQIVLAAVSVTGEDMAIEEWVKILT